MRISEFILPKRKYASRGPKGRHWWGKECVQHLSSAETPTSIAELPALEPNLPTAVSTVSGKKLVLSLPSTLGTSEAGQMLPTTGQL